MITSEMKINAMNKLLEDIRKTGEEIKSLGNPLLLSEIEYRKYKIKQKNLIKAGGIIMKKAHELYSILNDEEKEFVKITTDYSEIMESGE